MSIYPFFTGNQFQNKVITIQPPSQSNQQTFAPSDDGTSSILSDSVILQCMNSMN